MPRVAVRNSKALAALLRERRQELGYTLREAEERSRSFGKVIPFSTIGRIESAKVDPGVLRLQQLLRLYDIPAGVALDLAELENQTGELPKAKNPEHLYEETLRLWHAGEVGPTLAHMHALRHAVAGRKDLNDLRQRAQLQFAIIVASLGRFYYSRDLLEHLLREPLPAPTRLKVLVQLARCWERLGLPELGYALLARAEVHAKGAGARERACIAHEYALLALAEKNEPEARTRLEEAARLYAAAKDPEGVVKTQFSLARLLLAMGHAEEAITAGQRLVKLIDQGKHTRLRPEASVLLGHALLAGGRVDEAVRQLRDALGEAISADQPGARFFAHHYLAEAYRRAGEPIRADAEAQSARQYRRYVNVEPDAIKFAGGKQDGASTLGHHKRQHRHRQRP